MTHQDRSRWSGLSLALGGLLLLLGTWMHPDETVEGARSAAAWGSSHYMLFASLILAVFGLTGLYARLTGGVRSLVGYVLAIASSIVFAGVVFMEAFIAPSVEALGPEGAALLEMEGPIMTGPLSSVMLATIVGFILGYLLLGLSVWQEAGLPQWAGALMVAGGILLPLYPPLPLIVFKIGGLLICAAMVWIGWTMWSAPAPAAD